MPIDLSIPATARITLFVEDPLTRDYLRRVWDTPIDVEFRLGGGNDGVRAIVKTFEQEGHPNVFGVTDRDFRPSNQAEWVNPTKQFRSFVLPVHEIENYLLQAEALHASPYHNRGLGVADLERRMREKATGLCWWAACRETIAELKRRFRDPFVPDPRQAVVDEESAYRHICDSEWFEKLARGAARSAESDIRQQLRDDRERMGLALESGAWRRDFAGKEILRDVAGWMCDETRISKFPTPRAQFYSDLAKEIGAWQMVNDAIPEDLAALLLALRTRIASG